jgi:DNA gyrase/topoisomerase IV subunit A
MKGIYFLFYFLITTILLPTISLAEIKTIYEECEYVMGDNDTKNDAKRLCLIEAKRKVLERVGTYVESNTNVLNFNLTRDEIRAYTAGIIKTDIVSESVSFNGKSTVIQMKIKADVDTSVLANKMLEIHRDKDLAQKYSKMQDDYKQLERQIKELQNKLKGGDTDWATVEKARLEREEAFNRLSALERVKQDIKQKSYLAVQNVEIGMTKEEVIRLIGPPRSENFHNLNYGNVWVIIENGVVVLLVDARCYNSTNSRREYFNTLNLCGAGKGIIKY